MSASKPPSTALTPGDRPEAKGAAEPPSAGHTHRPSTRALALAALGVVYGDIGTSPLYALRECFSAQYGLAPTVPNVLGILSVILWTLLVVISVKYLLFVLRADYKGEGGILALVGLVQPDRGSRPGWSRAGILLALGLLGAALLYGDGVITPAISVLSAVEGLQVSMPGVQKFVVPIAVVILVLLFMFERKGTAGVGKAFGPTMLVWFLSIAVLGLSHVTRRPFVLLAANPLEAVAFFRAHGAAAWLVLGAVVLAVTGGEALYADIGHFGKTPIRLTWYTLVLPALILSYFGQGALLLQDARAVQHPFFQQLDGWGRYPLVALATVATVIASQAVISGVFSLTMQGVELQYCPHVEIRHTSHEVEGQIYLPGANYALMFGCVSLVLAFRSSSALASAYGVAVTGTMVITTLLFFVVARRRWHWPLWLVVLPFAAFTIVDLAFFSSNITKVISGGWVPLVIAGVLYLLAVTWKHGRELLARENADRGIPLEEFIRRVEREALRSPGTGIFLSSQAEFTPPNLVLQVRNTHAVHEQVVLLVVSLADEPHVPRSERARVEQLGDGFRRVVARYGYADAPSIPDLVRDLRQRKEITAPDHQTTYFVHHVRVQPAGEHGMARWRVALFAFMHRNARAPTEYFGLPPDQVVELGGVARL